MKFERCPKCGYDTLSDNWKPKRLLQQCCPDCNWQGPLRTPEQKIIEEIKYININYFSGFIYEIFDRYGHLYISSRSFEAKKDAELEMKEYLKKGESDPNAGPYIALLWPDKIKVKAEVYLNRGKISE